MNDNDFASNPGGTHITAQEFLPLQVQFSKLTNHGNLEQGLKQWVDQYNENHPNQKIALPEGELHWNIHHRKIYDAVKPAIEQEMKDKGLASPLQSNARSPATHPYEKLEGLKEIAQAQEHFVGERGAIHPKNSQLTANIAGGQKPPGQNQIT